MRNIQQRNMSQHSLQSPRNIYQSNSSMLLQSQPHQFHENNINPNSYVGYHSLEYETLHSREAFSLIAENSSGSSIDSLQAPEIDFEASQPYMPVVVESEDNVESPPISPHTQEDPFTVVEPNPPCSQDVHIPQTQSSSDEVAPQQTIFEPLPSCSHTSIQEIVSAEKVSIVTLSPLPDYTSLKNIASERRKNLSSEDEKDFVPNDDSDYNEFPDSQCPPDATNVDCLFCEGLFKEDNHGEIWIKCLMCNLWAHNECAGAKMENYVYDFYVCVCFEAFTILFFI
ncbi:hypothetical protein FQR65_LT19480 [Abscondita terminalis]|nr:hypothetical protein FQR65_LT19480 [Abscondita terminalis]